MPEIISITSEALQATIRRLLPSQQGFGDDLQATNLITPVIDLTAAAQSNTVSEVLQNALALNSQTAFAASGSTVVIANTTGFFRIFGASTIMAESSGSVTNSFTMTDGTTTKTIWAHDCVTSTNRVPSALNYDFVVFIGATQSISAVSGASNGKLTGSSRQIADVNGNAVNPAGFTPQ